MIRTNGIFWKGCLRPKREENERKERKEREESDVLDRHLIITGQCP